MRSEYQLYQVKPSFNKGTKRLKMEIENIPQGKDNRDFYFILSFIHDNYKQTLPYGTSEYTFNIMHLPNC